MEKSCWVFIKGNQGDANCWVGQKMSLLQHSIVLSCYTCMLCYVESEPS